MKTKTNSQGTPCPTAAAADLRSGAVAAGQHFIGIDYHKRYSVFCVLDEAGAVQERGRIDHGQRCP